MSDEKTAAELKEDLKSASPEEREAIVAAEQERDNPRKSVLEAAGVDEAEGPTDANGRVLNPWEIDPDNPPAEPAAEDAEA